MCVLLQSKEIKAPVKIGRFGLAVQCTDGQTLQVKLVTSIQNRWSAPFELSIHNRITKFVYRIQHLHDDLANNC